MFSSTYNLDRFWCPINGTIDLTDSGYLRDPESDTLWTGQSDSVPFEYIEDVPCLILLGEPGIGKTTWFTQTKDALAMKIRSKGHGSLWVDLGLFAQPGEVVNAIFEHEEFLRWLRGRHWLHLFLDGFDECHSHVPVLPKRFLHELGKCPVERMCLRILSRTAVWPASMEEGLTRLWRKCTPNREGSAAQAGGADIRVQSGDYGPVQAFELAPLRRRDVAEIVGGAGVDPASFMSEIQTRQLVPFAIRPQTLSFLLKVYQSRGRFPSSLVELYGEGCREQCREPSQERIDARLSGSYGANERLAFARRIAALTIFCSRLFILKHDGPSTEAEDTDITIRDLALSTELGTEGEAPVQPDLIRETLDTALFSGRPGNRMGWAHQTCAEFLAGEYLVTNRLPLSQIMTLIQHPHDPEGKIPPQLVETAAWLALMNDRVLEALLSTDPEILLLKELKGVTESETNEWRRKLVHALLLLLDQGKLLDNRIAMMPLEYLRHPDLADQLRPYIVDSQKNFVVRRVAIRIAKECGITELQNAVCGVVLDPEEDLHVRQPGARALLVIGDDDVKARLNPLAYGLLGDDPEDELKGCALMALWPGHLTAEELFDVITPPKNPSYGGTYTIDFLNRALIERLEADHLAQALRWIQRLPQDDDLDLSFTKVIKAIMTFAHGQLEYPAVFEQFARAAFTRLREHQAIIPSGSTAREDRVLFSDEAKRRRLVARMIALVAESNESARFGAHLISKLVTQNDLQWLIEVLMTESRQKVREIAGFLIGWFFDPGNDEELQSVYELRDHVTSLAEVLRRRLGSVDLDSDEARLERRCYARETEQEQAEQQPQLQCTSDTVVVRLQEIQTGNSARFQTLVWQMIDPERRASPYGSLPTDLSGLKVWQGLEEQDRQRIAEAAWSYLRDCDPETSEWIGTRRISWSAWAGYIALKLIMRTAPSSLSSLPDHIWQTWAPAIVACIVADEYEDGETLVALTYARVRDEVIANLGRQIDYENGSSKNVFCVEKLGKCWDSGITGLIVDKLNEPNMAPGSYGSLLLALLEHDFNVGRRIAKAQLAVPLPARGRGRMRALVTAKILMLKFPLDSWELVWSAITGARRFGRKLLSVLANEPGFFHGELFDEFSLEHLATLYSWIAREFPSPEKDPSHRFSRAPTAHDTGERILRYLQDRGTVESLNMLRKLCKDLPGQAERLRWVVAAAKDRILATTWTPWLPQEILSIVHNHNKRLVQSGDQLLTVVIESLQRFQRELHDELPAVRDLWDLQHGEDAKRWRPVDEPTLSHRIARHLQDDLAEKGIVVGREVEIRPGELTDIHVDADAMEDRPDRLRLIKVIVEVKGCWNAGIDTDMQKQLVERYLAENQCEHGLYLVGWFHCDHWDRTDDRRRRPRREIYEKSVVEAQTLFDGQAGQLSQSTGKTIRALVLDTGLRPVVRT